MSQEENAKTFVPQIFELEANGMFQDITLTPSKFFNALSFDKVRIDRAISYIKSVLKECYDLGHMKLAVINDGDTLIGYSILFNRPNSSCTSYLHKIFVKEEYRGRGFGKQMLEALVTSASPITLLCTEEKRSFYESNGFEYAHDFMVPDANNFALSKELYEGFCVMRNSVGDMDAPIFILNDEDIRNIMG